MEDKNNKPEGLSQAYINDLKEELETAKHNFDKFRKAAILARGEYDAAKEWETCLGSYFSKLTTTFGIVTDLKNSVSILDNFAQNNLSPVLGQAESSVEILMNCVRCLTNQNETLKQTIKDLLEIIDCLNKPILNPATSIMKSLTDLKNKVDEGITANLAAFKECLNLLNIMYDFQYAIQKKDSGGQDLVADICRLVPILNCKPPHTGTKIAVACGPVDDQMKPITLEILNEAFTNPECKDAVGDKISLKVPESLDCEEIPSPKMCMECKENEDNYLVKFKGKWTAAGERVCYHKYVWMYYEGEAQKAKDRHDATKASLDAAQAAKDKCK